MEIVSHTILFVHWLRVFLLAQQVVCCGQVHIALTKMLWIRGILI